MTGCVSCPARRRWCSANTSRFPLVVAAVTAQATLLPFRFYRNKPHRWPRHCLADRRRIVGVVLVALEIGLHITASEADMQTASRRCQRAADGKARCESLVLAQFKCVVARTERDHARRGRHCCKGLQSTAAPSR